MAQWKIHYYQNQNGKLPVKEWLDEIGHEPKSEIFRIFTLLQKYGTELGLPFVKPLEQKIYEVRAKDKSGIYRILYFAYTDKTFVMLHGFQKKTQATPRRELDIAIKRLKEVQNG